MSKQQESNSEKLIEQLYRGSRSGAVSYRGFYFQDVISAWIAVRLLGGDLKAATRVVPEDWEDLSLEGPIWTHIQVKSRQVSRGPFKVSEVTKFIIEMWEKHFERTNAGVPSDKLLLILERGLDTDTRLNTEELLTDLPQWKKIRKNLEEKAPALVEDIDWLESHTYIHVIDIPTAIGDSTASISKSYGTYHAVSMHITQMIQQAVRKCTEKNANADMAAARVGLARSDLQKLSDTIVGLIDSESLEEALSFGDCEVLDFSAEESASGFYHGVSVQPGHITANLAAERSDLTSNALSALRGGAHVLYSGISGVGKSTVMWQTAHVTPEILWYRVKTAADQQSIVRILKLVKALGPATDRQVGLIIDDVGRDQARLWDALVREVSAIPGVVLLGSIRTEDLYQIETRASLRVIDVKLDEGTAALIHAKLLQDDATEMKHWREAYKNSGSLTMEYTHILTQGLRLAELVDEQVSRRVRENRDLELDIIAIVSTADQWGVEIGIEPLVSALHSDRNGIRKAFSRLRDEHILRGDDRIIRGVHQLRSQFLSRSVHTLPPPSLQQTIKTLLRLVTPNNLSKIIKGSFLSSAISMDELLNELRNLIIDTPTELQPEYFGCIMDALREIEFYDRIPESDQVMEASGISIPLRITTLQMALAKTSFTDFSPIVERALPRLQKILEAPYRTPAALIDRLPRTYVSNLLASSTSIDFAMQILSGLLGVAIDGELLDETEVAESRLKDTLQAANVKDLGDLLTLSKTIGAKLTGLLSDLAGGDSKLLKRLETENPYIISAKIKEYNGEKVPTVRILYGSAGMNADFDQLNRNTAKLAAQLFPLEKHVDVRTQFAGEKSVVFGGIEHGVSTLKQKYIYASSDVRWRRRMLAMASVQYSPRSQTERTSVAASLLKDVERFVAAVAKGWLLGTSEAAASATKIHRRVQSKLSTLAPFVAPEFDDPDAFELKSDALYSFVDSVFNNVTRRLVNPDGYGTLSAFLRDNLRSLLRKVVATEAWELIDFDPATTAEAIESQLLALGRLVAEIHLEGSLNEKIRLRARSGNPKTSLARAGNLAHQFQINRQKALLDRIIRNIREQGLKIRYHTRELDPARLELWPPYELLILIDVPTLMDWPLSLEKLVEVIDYDNQTLALLPEIWVAPCVKGYALSRFCCRVGNNVLPDRNALEEWTNKIGELPQLPFSSTLFSASDTLEELSNIAYLQKFRNIDALQEAIDLLSDKYRETANELLAAVKDDSRLFPFLEWISALSERVVSEFNEPDYLDENTIYFAVECVKMFTQPESVLPAYQERMAVNTLAIQYDIDPSDAALVAFLDGDESEPRH